MLTKNKLKNIIKESFIEYLKESDNPFDPEIVDILKTTFFVDGDQQLDDEEVFASGKLITEARLKLKSLLRFAASIYYKNYDNVHAERIDPNTIKIFYSDKDDDYYDLYTLGEDSTLAASKWLDHLYFDQEHPLVELYDAALATLGISPVDHYKDGNEYFPYISSTTGEVLYEVDIKKFNLFMNDLTDKYLKDDRNNKDYYYCNKIVDFIEKNPVRTIHHN